MRSPRELDLEIVDTVLEPPIDGRGAPVVRVGKAGDTRFYRVRVFLEGNDLPFVRSVTYHLHESFPDPHRTVERSSANPSCEIVIWTWGIFDIRAEIRDREGSVYEVVQPMQYGEELRRVKVKVVNDEAFLAHDAKPKLRT
jgi:hypothetical protein